MLTENLYRLSGTEISKFSKNYLQLRFFHESLADSVSKFARIRLYQDSCFIMVHLAETVTKTKFQRFDCCLIEVAMIDIKVPECRWQNNVYQYNEEGN